MSKGYFIVFEGPDGSGKSTVSQAVYTKLIAKNYNVVLTREPGGSRIAECIRDIILDPINTEMDVRSEALLYAASRRQHLIEKVLPAIKAGKTVICDRFVDSSLAYQAYGREIDLDKVIAINDFAIEGYYPDLTIFLNIDVETGLKRLQNRKSLDRLDLEDLVFHQRVFAGYKEILADNPDKYVLVEAIQPIEEVVTESLGIIEDFINER